MKKFLITGAFTLALSAFLFSCADDDNDFTSIAELKQATFAENFVKFYGPIDPNQDWGFSSTTSNSRVTRTIKSGWNGWASAPNEADFKSRMPSTLPISSYGNLTKDVMYDYSMGAGSDVQTFAPYNGNFALYVQGIKKLAFTNPGDGAEHMYFYVLPGADLTITTRFDKNGAGDFKMYVANGAKVTFEQGLNSSIKLYNRGEIVVKGDGQSGAYATGVIYNQGTMTFEGTSTDYFGSIKPYGGNVSGALVIENDHSQVINEGILNSKGLRVEGTGHFKNVSGGQVNINGYTIVNSNQCSWINDGEYNTTNYYYTAGSQDVINNCRLNVSELFYMNLGDTDVNSFQMDGGSSVVCKNYFGDAPGFIKMGSKSLFKVKETATMNHTKANYGIYCVGDDYAVFQAKNIVATNIEQAYEVTYGGKLYVVAQTHFDSPNFDSKSGQYPIIDFKNGFTKSNIYLGGDTPDIKISASVCNPGFPEGYSDEGDLNIISAGTGSETSVQQWEVKTVIDHKRVFCEDLGSSSNRRDYDYNDVVFDAKIIESYFEDRTYNGTSVATTSSPYGLNYYAEITVLAAGGELSLSVGEDKEVNSLFKKPTNMIINTVSPAEMETFVASHNRETLDPVTFRYTFPLRCQNRDSAIIKNIPIMVKSQNVPIYLKADKGEAPQKICVPVGTRWPYERVAIDEAYGNFTQWVGHTNSFTPEMLWGSNVDESKLYPNIGATRDETGTVSSSWVQNTQSNTFFTFTVSETESIIYDQSANEGQYLSTTPIFIDKSYFAISGRGSVIRLYGADYGNVQVIVKAGNVALGKTTRADGKAYIYTLNTAQAASAKENGIMITGSNFKLYYVTVDDSDIDRTVEIEPTFTSNEITGTSVSGISSPTAIPSTGFSVANSYFANAGEGTEVYVYGTGDDSSVNISVNGANLSRKGSSRITRTVTYKTRAKKVVKFTLTAEQAAAAQTSGVKITGSNFTLHAVSVNVVEKQSEQQEDPETPEGGAKAGQIWPNEGAGSTQSAFTIDGNLFTDAMVGKTLRIYCSEYGQYYWQIAIREADNANNNDFAGIGIISNWANNGSHIAASFGSAAKNDSKQCIELTLSSELIAIFKTHGISATLTNLTVTNVTVE
jgi:hypothetical protein